MAKKKKKGKKKKKKGAEKKGPSVKELLQTEVVKLEDELKVVKDDLNLHRDVLENVKERHGFQVDRKDACTEYLMRRLAVKTAECCGAERELVLVQDLQELEQKRAAELASSISRSREVDATLFQRRKVEMQEKLNRLEAVRLQSVNQRGRLDRARVALAERNALSRRREEDSARVSSLLERRDKFERQLEGLAEESEKMFDLSLPVYAEQLLDRNLKLNEDNVAEKLLDTQNMTGCLRKKLKILDVEMESQAASENRTKEVKEKLLRRLQKTVGDIEELETDEEAASSSEEQDLESKDESDDQRNEYRKNKLEMESEEDSFGKVRGAKQKRSIEKSEGTKTRDFKTENRQMKWKNSSREGVHVVTERDYKTSSKNVHPKHFGYPKTNSKDLDTPLWKDDYNCEVEAEETEITTNITSINDKLVEMREILRDQKTYKKSLKEEMKRRFDRNGSMTSIILRGRAVLQSRSEQVEKPKDSSRQDYDVLQQLRMLMDELDVINNE